MQCMMDRSTGKLLGMVAIGIVIGAFVGLLKDAQRAKDDEFLFRDRSRERLEHNSMVGSCTEDSSDSISRLMELLEYSSGSEHVTRCRGGGDGGGVVITSLNATASRFGGSETRVAVVPHGGADGMYETVSFHFQAYNESFSPRQVGGDEFRLTLWTYTKDGIATKTAAIAHDFLNGTYRVSMTIPSYFDQYRMDLIHLYTCFDGYRPGCLSTRFHTCAEKLNLQQLDSLGPVQVTHDKMTEFTLRGRMESEKNDSIHTTCTNSQKGIEEMSQAGYWSEHNIPAMSDLSQSARWFPLCCVPTSQSMDRANKIFRVGDSTMPSQTLQIGFAYNAHAHYSNWIQFLMNNTELRSALTTDIMVLQAGLHQLYFGFRPETVVDILLLMLCQIASSFTGKIIMLGPNPVQQQLFRAIDIRDGDARLIVAMLQDQIVRQHNGSLLSICRSLKLKLSSLILVADENGNVSRNQTYIRQVILNKASDTEAKNTASILGVGPPQDPSSSSKDTTFAYLQERLEKVNDTQDELITLFDTPLEQQFVQQMTNLDMETIYGNRTVWVTNLRAFLLSRDDTYRDHDKLHDLKGQFFWNRHGSLVNLLATMRSFGNN